MYPKFFRTVTLSTLVLCLFTILGGLVTLAAAQAAPVAKHRLSRSVATASPAMGVAARKTARKAPPPLTADTWTGGASDGNWGTAGNWSAGVPTSADAVTIGGGANVNMNVAGTFGTLALTGATTTLAIVNNENLTADGNIANSGAISLNSVGNGTDLIIGAANVTLSGAGSLVMGNNSNNIITGAAATDTFTNGQTISGAGNIGNNSMALVNNTGATINANQSNALYVDTSNGTTNKGTMEATAGGTLILYGQAANTINNASGTISAAAGSTVELQNGIVINGGTLSTSGTGLIQTTSTSTLQNLTIAGNYQLDNNDVNTLVGTIVNNGNINLASVGNATYLELSGNVTLNGTGTLTMSNNANNYIFGASGAGTEVLTNNINISGAGNIGDGQTILVNTTAGTINANQSNVLNISPTASSTAGVTNTGLLEATSGGTLNLNNGTYINAVGSGQGTILANGGTVNLNNGVTIVGGTLQSENSGVIQTTASSTLNGSTSTGAVTIATGSSLVVSNDTVLNIQGSIVNNGNISQGSVGNATDLVVAGAAGSTATLSGTGTLTMDNNVNNRIYGATGTNVFINQETIQGAGDIGANQLIFTNQGTVNANASNGLTIYTSGGTTNTGTLEATATGTLILEGNTFANAGGKIQANGSSGAGNAAAVNLENGATITGGIVSSNSFGSINDLNTATLSGLTLASGTNVNIQNNTNLTLVGTIVNNGNLNLQSAGNGTVLEMSGNVALNGTGTITMSNNVNNLIYGAAGTNVLTLASTQTIQGSGNVGDGQMTLVNNGIVDANVSNPLTVQTSGGTTNTNILEATAGGTLNLNGASGGSITNTGAGTIVAGSGSTVNLINGITINGGSLTGSGTFVETGNATLSGLTNASTVQVANNNTMFLAGTIVNNGSIQLQSAGNGTILEINGNVALNGTGNITLSNNINNLIYGVSGSNVLTVASTQTIQGAGNVGDGQMTLVNNGIINANVSSALTVQTSGGVTNTATIEATAGGTLNLNGASGGVFTNTGAGTIVAGSGSTVNVFNGATLVGGSLTGAGTFVESGNVTLSGLTNASTIQVVNNNAMFLTGTITNNGSIQENSVGNGTEIELNGNVTLKGTGTLVMSDNSNNYIYGLSGTDVLTNASTIEGAGHIGDGQMSLVNSGTINATGGNTLTIAVSGTVNNTGTFEATNTGGLMVQAPTNGFLNYISGSNTLSGGTYIANGGNVYLPLGSSGGITTLAAKVTEEGGSQIFNSNNGNANALNGLTSITAAGGLTIGGVAFTDPGAFSNAGSLTILSGESFTVGSLSQISGNSLTAGTYVLDANLNLSGATQNITTNAANLTLAGGTIENANSTNALANLATNTGKLTLAGGANFTTVGNFNNTGMLTINSGSTFSVAGTLSQISGSALSGGTFVLGGNLDLTQTANITTNSSTLTLEGGTIQTGSTNDLANLATNAKSLTLANNANFTTTGNFTNNGALTANSGSTFTVLSGKSLTNYHNTGASANTLIGGTYTVAGTLAFNAGTTGAIKTDSANITMEGAGLIENTSAGAPSTNALINLATISSTGSFTLAQNANFTAAGNFTNSGKLTVDSGSTFGLTGTNVLTNLASGTLGSGTYTVGGTLQLTSANGGITTNAANLTLTGTTAKILDGTSNALSTFNNNTGTFALAAAANLTSGNSNFSNSGTVDIGKGSTFTIGGSAHSYLQTAGQTTLDGTITGAGGGLVTVTGGTILGAGTVKGTLSAGNATGNAVTVNVGDSGLAGLLSITGKYTQLATGNLTGTINGTTAGTGYSQMKVTGTAALAGTINFTVTTAFQASLTVNEQFTALTASSISGTFSNSTIAINSNFHFAVTYTTTGVILTVESGPAAAPTSSPAQAMAAVTLASAKPASKTGVVIGSMRPVASSKAPKFMVVAGSPQTGQHSRTLVARGSEWTGGQRIWERVPMSSSLQAKQVAIAPLRTVETNMSRTIPASQVRTMQPHSGVQLGGMAGLSSHRVPVKNLLPMISRVAR